MLVISGFWLEMEIKIYNILHLMAIEFFSFHYFSLASNF